MFLFRLTIPFVTVVLINLSKFIGVGDRRSPDRMVVGFTTQLPMQSVSITTKVVSSWRCVLDAALCDKLCQCLAASRWFSPCPPVSSTNKTDRHDVAEISLKVALNTLTLNITHIYWQLNVQYLYPKNVPFKNAHYF